MCSHSQLLLPRRRRCCCCFYSETMNNLFDFKRQQQHTHTHPDSTATTPPAYTHTHETHLKLFKKFSFLMLLISFFPFRSTNARASSWETHGGAVLRVRMCLFSCSIWSVYCRQAANMFLLGGVENLIQIIVVVFCRWSSLVRTRQAH